MGDCDTGVWTVGGVCVVARAAGRIAAGSDFLDGTGTGSETVLDIGFE
jgi:hypothetical protein